MMMARVYNNEANADELGVYLYYLCCGTCRRDKDFQRWTAVFLARSAATGAMLWVGNSREAAPPGLG